MAKLKSKVLKNYIKKSKFKSNSNEQTISQLSDLTYCPVISKLVRKSANSTYNISLPSLSSTSNTKINSPPLFHDPTTNSNNGGNISSLGFIFKKVFKFLKLCPDGSNCYC